jgi:hypothetical protein
VALNIDKPVRDDALTAMTINADGTMSFGGVLS